MEQPTDRRRSRSPLLVAALVVVALIVCAGVAVGGYFLAQSQGWLPGAEEEKTDLLRMLAFVPDRARYREGGVWFGDKGRFFAVNDLPPVRSLDDLETLSQEERRQWMRLSNGIWASNFSGYRYAVTGRWRDAFGYDWFQVEREITAGQPPEWFGIMEGTFDADEIKDALDDLGYQEDEYQGAAYYHVRDDFEIDLKDEGSRLTLAALNRMVVGETMILAAPATGILERVLDVQAGRRDSLADNPAYAALARAMGPVVSAAFLEGEQFHDWRASLPARLPPEVRDKLKEQLDLQGKLLHPYDLVGFGYLDDGYDQAILVALAYDDAEYAEADASMLSHRLEDAPSLVRPERMLSDYWLVGEPEVHSFEDGSVLAIRLELDNEAPPGLWLRMLLQRDVLFLAVNE